MVIAMTNNELQDKESNAFRQRAKYYTYSGIYSPNSGIISKSVMPYLIDMLENQTEYYRGLIIGYLRAMINNENI